MGQIFLGVVLLLAASVGAQGVLIGVRAANPLITSVVVGGNPFSQVQPAGPLLESGNVSVSTPATPQSVTGCRAHFSWAVQATWGTAPIVREIRCGMDATVDFTGGAAMASVGLHDIVFDLQAQAPRDVLVDIDMTAQFFGASALPTLEVDVGDNGSIDAWLGGGHVLVPLSLGVASVPIRVRCGAAIGVPNPVGGSIASMYGGVTIRVAPDNDLLIQQTVLGCSGVPLGCEAAFTHQGVVLSAPLGPLSVLVLGLQPQPWVFTNLLGSSCVVVPSLDVLLQPNGSLDLPIPASVRPVTLHAQAIFAFPFFLEYTFGATEAYRIFAW